MRILLRSLTILCVFTATSLYAAVESNMQCQKVVIAGNAQWPPYTVQQDNILSGIGIDLAKRIFSELDVAYEEIAYDNIGHMMQGLRDGEIDVIVSTYDYDGIMRDVQLLQPAYMIDPVTIAVANETRSSITSWDSLIGSNGIAEETFVPEDQISEFLSNYLNLSFAQHLLAALQSVKTGANKYMVGSELQLTYGIKANHLQSDLTVMKNLAKGGDVYMAFSNASPCKQYAVYVQKRLQDYKNNGTVDKILQKYIH